MREEMVSVCRRRAGFRLRDGMSLTTTAGLFGLIAAVALLLAPTLVTCDHSHHPDYATSIERLNNEFPDLVPPEMMAFLDMLQSGSPRRLLQMAEENAEEPRVRLRGSACV